MLNLSLLILQIVVILVVSRLFGRLFRLIHQPQVMGEMVAGVVLGASLLGRAAPDLYARLFPAESLAPLNALSQLGLLLFMFLIGLELDLHLLRGRGRATGLIGFGSILLPILMGIPLAVMLFSEHAGEGVSLPLFILFVGSALCMTAFPFIARILSERKLLRTELGAVTVASAALNDVAGWIILALVTLLARSDEHGLPMWAILAGMAVYTLLMLFPMQRFMCWIEDQYAQRGQITHGILAVVLLFMLVSAWATESLHVHALFGAFMAGVIMPRRHDFVHALTERLNDFTTVFLLPLFFAYTGLRTDIGLLNGMSLWLMTGLVILVAVVSKIAGSSLPARWSGMSWRDAGALGILMNARGLIGLVLLNVGLELQLISPVLFTMLVVMALATTFLTAPLMEWFFFRRLLPEEYRPAAPELAALEIEEIFPAD